MAPVDQGGLGGVGGRGCYPLVHASKNPHRPNGSNGARGRSGRRGSAGRLLVSREFRHQYVQELIAGADLTDEQALQAVTQALVANAGQSSWRQHVASTTDGARGRNRR